MKFLRQKNHAVRLAQELELFVEVYAIIIAKLHNIIMHARGGGVKSSQTAKFKARPQEYYFNTHGSQEGVIIILSRAAGYTPLK